MFYFKHITLIYILINVPINYCKNNATNRIVGGTEAKREDWPFLVSLANPKRSFCGGTLVTPTCVVTAGHCFDQIHDNEKLHIIVGSVKLDCNDCQVPVKRYEQHKDYKHHYGGTAFDIAIFMLEEEVKISATVGTASLSEKTPEPGTLCKAAGWGVTVQGEGDQKQDLPDTLLEVELPIISPKDCGAFLNDSIHHRQASKYLFPIYVICTLVPEGGKDTCQGDSGGPLMCNGAFAGITSFGQGCAMPNKPGVYTDVSEFRQWIIDKCEIKSREEETDLKEEKETLDVIPHKKNSNALSPGHWFIVICLVIIF